MSLFEQFKNLNLPEQSNFLSDVNTSHDGDPNGGTSEVILGAPLGTLFWEKTAGKWWRRAATGWKVQGMGMGSSCLIYEPGSTKSGPVAFGVWSDLMAQLALLRDASNDKGCFVISFSDASLSANFDPIVIPVDTNPYDMTGVVWDGSPSPGGANVHISDGAHFVGLRAFRRGIFLRNLNTTNPADDSLGLGVNGATAGVVTIDESDVAGISGGAPLYGNTNIASGKFVICRVRNGSTIGNNSNGPIFDMPAGAFLVLSMEDAKTHIERDTTIVGAVGSVLIEEHAGSGKYMHFPGWLGTRLDLRQQNTAALQTRPFNAVSSLVALTAGFGEHLRLNASSGPIAQALPDISSALRPNPGGFMTVVEVGGGQVTLNAAAGDTIAGNASLMVPPGGGVLLESDGVSSWDVVGVFNPSAPEYRVDAAYVSSTPDALTAGRLARYNTTVASIVSNLPAAIAVRKNTIITVKNEIGANVVNVTPNGSDTIDSVAAVHLVSPSIGTQFVSDGVSNWTAV